ncbi:hypothetical protein [Burkholderia pyrrocinia]|uniref:hypothetical protein n=1 Tax=Burkholderia pyrrocinia TaxID=60550 RepID=UPI002AB0A66C|nr:hypothetical protein [Burkholderia pyrrocinia]
MSTLLSDCYEIPFVGHDVGDGHHRHYKKIETRRSASRAGKHAPVRANGFQKEGTQEMRVRFDQPDKPGMPIDRNGVTAVRRTESS